MITAYDNAVKDKLPRVDNPFFSDLVPLLSFLRELFGEHNCETLFKSTYTTSVHATRSQARASFEEIYKDAYVRFTHFGIARFNEGNEINTGTILAAFVRGMAFQCDNNHKPIDIIIPIVMKASGILQESDMLAIFIQIKNRVDVRKLLDLDTIHPSIVLDMHLEADQQDFTVRTSKTDQPGIFSIIVKGLDNYPAIPVHDKPHYQRLLTTSDLLNDHSRQDEDSLTAMKRLKPFWGAGDEFYDWFD